MYRACLAKRRYRTKEYADKMAEFYTENMVNNNMFITVHIALVIIDIDTTIMKGELQWIYLL